MAFTFSNIASVASNSAMALGQAQAQTMGLGQTEANGLAITNLLSSDDEEGMVGNLLSTGLGGKNRLRGAGLKKDLMTIGQAALVSGPGRGTGLSASSGLGGSIISTIV